MPIAPCFDPTTGASGGSQGGGGGGGADLSALGFTAIDLTDGSWSLTDTNSLVDTVSHASGVNTVVMNADAGGTSNNAWGNSATQEGPRWHKKLQVQDATGGDVQVQSGDHFIFQAVMELVTPDQKFAASSCVCVSADATSTAAATADIIGAMLRYPSTGNPQHGALANSFGSVNANLNNHQVATTVMVRSQRQAAVTYINTNSSGGYIFEGRDVPSTTYANGTTDLDLIVGVGTFSTGSITAGDDVKVKAWYRVIVMSDPA